MKVFLTLSILFLGFANGVLAETKDAGPDMNDPKMQAWIKASTPGKEQEFLKQFLGKWDYKINMWMEPGAKPQVSSGKSVNESIFGGRYITQKATGISKGQPFEGMGIIGYDNVQKHYNTLWFDNMSTAMMTGTAEYDSEKKVIVEKSSGSCPMSPTGTKEFRSTMSLPENNSFKYEMYTNDESGKEFKMMEIVYTKK